MNKMLHISKKRLKGDDGHKVFSVRIKESTVKNIDEISSKTNRSRNEIINLMLEFCIENYIIDE